MSHDQTKLDKYVSREVRIIAMVLVVSGSVYNMVLVPLQKISNEVEYIKGNHLKHIEDDISEIRQAEKDEQTRNADRDKKLERIITMLEQHEKESNK
ncbi:MAG: hypothetical protein ACD_5C00016G0010 [uncultured bacterium]|nr:MAG: hypothetical protein ACD_5C00016G0010 [uncultured bacterium]